VALAAQGMTGDRVSRSAPCGLLKQVQLQEVRKQGAVRPVRPRAFGQTRLFIIMAIDAIQLRRGGQGTAGVVAAVYIQHKRPQSYIRCRNDPVSQNIVADATGELKPDVVLVRRERRRNRKSGRHQPVRVAARCAAVC